MDKSKILYTCHRCNTLPCTCIRDSSKLEFQLFKCKEPHCNFTGYTLNQLQEHHLDRHSSIPYSINTNIITSNGMHK